MGRVYDVHNDGIGDMFEYNVNRSIEKKIFA
jgi:hypothetical protein